MSRESQLVFLDTRHSLNPDNPSDVQFNLNFAAANDLTNYTLSVESVSFPNAVYPFNSNNNNIYFKENGGITLTAIITPSNYTAAEFVIELKIQLEASGTSTYTVTYDNQIKRLTINAGADTIQLVEGTRNAFDEMGFIIPTLDLSNLLGDNPIRLDGTQYIDVVSTIGNLNYSSNGRTNILARIPVLSGFGSIIYYENNSDDLLALVQYDMADIEIRLLDDKNNPWLLPSNANVSYVLKLIKLN